MSREKKEHKKKKGDHLEISVVFKECYTNKMTYHHETIMSLLFELDHSLRGPLNKATTLNTESTLF